MTAKRHWWIFASALGLYMIGMRFPSALLAERVGFDERRAATPARYDEAVCRWQSCLVGLEKPAPRKVLGLTDFTECVWSEGRF